MKLNNLSLRAQLLIWILIPIMSLGLLAIAIGYIVAVNFADTAYDDSLEDSTHAIATRISYEEEDQVYRVDLPSAAEAILKYDSEDKIFYQVIDPKGKVIAGDPGFAEPPVAVEASDEPVFWDSHLNGFPVRVATLRVPVEDERPKDITTIQVAQTYTGRYRLTTEIVGSIILLQVLLALLSAGCVWLGVNRGLASLEKIRQSFAQRSPRDFKPVDEQHAPAEVRPLLGSINELLGRLSRDMEFQRRFVANAAHQLRTPLAGLKTQVDLAASTDDPGELKQSIAQIQSSVNSTVYLTQQLLSLARSENPNVFERMDLAKLARQVTGEFVPQAMGKNIDLGYAGAEGGMAITGDMVSIREMISNLIDNAVRYTPSGGKVTVSVAQQRDRLVFAVEDNGTGIPSAEREHVFERFYRILVPGQSGSGLGLAIVKEVAERHGAQAAISSPADGTGTVIEVRFPVA